MGRKLSIKEMNIIKHDDAVRNAKKNRGEIDYSNVLREQHVVCGCGEEGCVFVSRHCSN